MRKLFLAVCLILSVGITALLVVGRQKEIFVKPNNVSLNEARYLADFNQTIDKMEADKIPPKERWHVLRDLTETTEIHVISEEPYFFSIIDQKTIRQIVKALQESSYVQDSNYPDGDPDVKVYFKKKDGFIMAGRLYKKEGVLNSPEGPIIKIDQSAASQLSQ